MSEGFIPYLERTRSYYSALGYPPYEWAHHDTTPFTASNKPLADARVVLISTAAVFQSDLGDQGPHAPYNAGAKFFQVFRLPVDPPPDLRISHLGYDRSHTSAADPNTYLPIAALSRAVDAGAIGSLADDLIGLPTNRSQRQTTHVDARDTLRACRELGADLALLVPT